MSSSRKTWKLVCCGCIWSYRDCSTSSVERQLTMAAASSVLFGFSSGPAVVAGNGCLGCSAPCQHHSYLCTGVSMPSRCSAPCQHHSYLCTGVSMPSQHRAATLPTRPMLLQAHRSTGLEPAYLPDFGK